MCVPNRSFAIKQMTNWGERCILVRDLNDSMYNPKARRFVPHDRGTALVIAHIQKYWAPTVLSDELLAAVPEGSRLPLPLGWRGARSRVGFRVALCFHDFRCIGVGVPPRFKEVPICGARRCGFPLALVSLGEMILR
jgi:hypothetical protein